MIAVIDLIIRSTTCLLVERNCVVTRLGAGSSSVGVTIGDISDSSQIKTTAVAAVTSVERRVHDLIARHDRGAVVVVVRGDIVGLGSLIEGALPVAQKGVSPSLDRRPNIHGSRGSVGESADDLS